MTPISLGIMAVSGSFKEKFWMGVWTPTTSTYYSAFTGAKQDSAGNVYISGWGYADSASYMSRLAIKLDSTGALQWSNYSNAGGESKNASVDVDSSGNPVFFGYENNGSFNPVFNGYSTTGTIGTTYKMASNIAKGGAGFIDSSGNYVFLFNGPTGGYVSGIVRVTPTGTRQLFFTNNYGLPSTANVNARACVTPDGNYYYYTATDDNNTGTPFTVKLSTAGVVQWTRSRPTTYLNFTQTTTTDASSNVYVTMAGNTIYKLDSSGAMQWIKRISVTDNYHYAYAATDSAGNIYATMSNSANTILYILKMDTSGNALWIREFSVAGGGTIATGNLYLNGTSVIITSASTARASGGDGFILKVPQDGSKTGTYVVSGKTYTYATSSATLTTDANNTNSYTVVASLNTTYTSSTSAQNIGTLPGTYAVTSIP